MRHGVDSQPFRMNFRRTRKPKFDVRKYQMLPPLRLYEVQRDLHQRIARRLPRLLGNPPGTLGATRP